MGNKYIWRKAKPIREKGAESHGSLHETAGLSTVAYPAYDFFQLLTLPYPILLRIFLKDIK